MIDSKTIVFIHGLFQTPDSWSNWKKFFEQKGYTCYAPAFPYHEGEPSELRKNINPELASVTLKNVLDHFTKFIISLPEKPIVIGHSMGGLIVQKLISSNTAEAGICINSAPPKGIFSFKWSFLKSNLPIINPFKGNSTYSPSIGWFHYAFCHNMSTEQARIEYNKSVVPESRNIARTSTKKDGAIDFSKPHKPLLFLAGSLDHIIPVSLNQRNFKAYKDSSSIISFKEFPNRTHLICVQENWQEVAIYVDNWIEKLQ